jgi:hypothetical protein
MRAVGVAEMGQAGWHNPDLKVDFGLHCGCRLHPQNAMRALWERAY